jgi:DNA-binding LytR/AlgR family response regulator
MSPAARWRASEAMGVPIRALPRREPRCHRRITGPVLPPLKWVAPPNSDKVLEGFCPEPHTEEQIAVTSNGLMLFLRLADLEWMEAAGGTLTLHVGQKTYQVRGTLAGIVAKLPQGRFLRVASQTLVNIQQIKDLQFLRHNRCGVVLESGTRLIFQRN